MGVALLRAPTGAAGVPGYEHRIRDLVRDELAAVADDVRSDARGSLAVTVEGDPESEILAAAHLNEFGN